MSPLLSHVRGSFWKIICVACLHAAEAVVLVQQPEVDLVANITTYVAH